MEENPPEEDPISNRQLSPLSFRRWQFERSIIRERVNAGLRAARARGVRPGRKPTLAGHQEAVNRLVAEPGSLRIVPQRQASKGRLIATAALELSTNQITHFYSDKKNTDEMIRMLELLVSKYRAQARIFFRGMRPHGMVRRNSFAEWMRSTNRIAEQKTELPSLNWPRYPRALNS